MLDAATRPKSVLPIQPIAIVGSPHIITNTQTPTHNATKHKSTHPQTHNPTIPQSNNPKHTNTITHKNEMLCLGNQFSAINTPTPTARMAHVHFSNNTFGGSSYGTHSCMFRLELFIASLIPRRPCRCNSRSACPKQLRSKTLYLRIWGQGTQSCQHRSYSVSVSAHAGHKPWLWTALRLPRYFRRTARSKHNQGQRRNM